MSCDRIIQFKDRRPTPAELIQISTNLLGGVGSVSEMKGDRFEISLPGTPTFALNGVKGAYGDGKLRPEHPTRWIEVIPTKSSVDVLTRTQDEFTCGIADTLAEIIARFYQGELED